MRILVISQYYAPEPVRISDICEELVKRGHTVDVITGVPNYPMGKIYEGYGRGRKKNETLNGVHLHRSFTIGRRTGVFFRVLNYYSFAISSSVYSFFLKKEYDVVLVNQLSPVMMACAGVTYKLRHKKRLVYYTLDLWPESLVTGGIKRGSLIYRLFDRISRRLYRRADKILVTSQNFIPYLHGQHGVSLDRLSYMPQYAEELFSPSIGEKKDTVDLVFAGNVGAVQSVNTIIAAAKKLEDVENLYFHIVGDGSALVSAKAYAIELNVPSVIFHGRKPLEQMPNYYKMADAMLVSLAKDPFISLTLPGKVQSYLASGKAIIGSIDGEASELIKEARCGLCAPAEDADALARCIREFLKSDKKTFEQNAYSYYCAHFKKERFMDTLINALCD